MKYKRGNYLQLPREIFQSEEFKGLSVNARWLYVVLSELEHRFTNKKDNFFFRSNEELVNDAGMSLPTLKRAKKELKESGLVTIRQMHWVDKKTKKKSEKHITAFIMDY